MSKNKKKEKRLKEKREEPSLDKKLLKKLGKESEPPVGPMITNPKIFPHIIGLTKQYLECNHNSEAARQFVAGLAFEFRKEALARFSHDTVETFALAHLLREQVQGKARVLRKDAISHIMTTYPQHLRLDIYQQSAAEHIQAVWFHFGKASGLFGSGRNLLRADGSGKVIHPVENMSQEDWKHYREVYSPWYNKAKEVMVENKNERYTISVAAIIFKVLVEDIYPEEIDGGFHLKRGRAHRVLRLALTHYLSPGKLALALYPPKKEEKPQAQPGGEAP